MSHLPSHVVDDPKYARIAEALNALNEEQGDTGTVTLTLADVSTMPELQILQDDGHVAVENLPGGGATVEFKTVEHDEEEEGHAKETDRLTKVTAQPTTFATVE